MYRDTRPADFGVATASTPESWAANFAEAGRMGRWKSFRFSRTKEWRLIKRYVPRRGRVLDAGCGQGEWVAFLQSRGYRAEGIDFSPELVKRLVATYPDTRWMEGDIRRMSAPAGSFDAVISWGVIEHDEAGPLAALREFRRVLRPDGVIIVTVPVDSAAQRRSAELMYRPPGKPQSFFQYFMSDDDLSRQVEEAGFTVLESGTLPGTVLNLVAPRLANRLQGRAYQGANFLAFLLLSRMERYRVMRYCIGRSTEKPAGRPRAT